MGFSFLESRWMQWGVIALILINAVLLVLRVEPAYIQYYALFSHIDEIILWVLTIDVSMRFWRASATERGWNIFESIIIFLSLAAYFTDFEMMRGLRLLLLLRVASFFPQLALLIKTFMKSLGALLSTLMVLVIIVLVYGYAGLFLFSFDPIYFSTLGQSILTVIQIIRFQDFRELIIHLSAYGDVVTWSYIISLFFCTACSFLNILAGVIVKAVDREMTKETALTQKELKILLEQLKTFQPHSSNRKSG